MFTDPLAGIGPDPDRSSPDEERELIAGYSHHSRLLLVFFVERGEVVRIISARLLTRYERSVSFTIREDVIRPISARDMNVRARKIYGLHAKKDPDVQ